MNLTRDVAQRIVGRITHNFDAGVSVTDAAARVIASTDPRLVSLHIPAATQAIATEQLITDTAVAQVAAPLIYADQVVGAIVIHDDPQRGANVARMACTLAELIIHQSMVIERLPHQQWAKDRFIAGLVRGLLTDPPELVVQEAALFGIDLQVPRIVVVINIEHVTQQFMREHDRHSALPVITHTLRMEQLHTQLLEHAQQIAHLHADDVYGFVDERWQVLLAAIDPARAHVCRDQIIPRIQPFLDEISRSLGVTTSAGVGRYYPHQQGLAQSFGDAKSALEAGRGLHGPGRVYCLEELGLVGFLCSDQLAIKSSLARQLITPLAADPDLLTTLDTFLHANLSPSHAAEQLHIHRHTLAYRLDKIARLTGRDPRQFEAAAELYAALMLYKIDPERS